MNAGSQILTGILMGLCVCILTACGRVEKERSETAVQGAEATLQQTAIPEKYYTENSKVTEVMGDPVFGDYGHLIFPVDIAISEDLELKDVEDILPWYSEVNPKKTAAVIMQYTGLSSVTGQEPPTYACVGTSDYIASYESMEQYISRLRRNGTNAEIEVFTGLSHGFGLGEGTVAGGWINRAMDFWQQNSSK